MDIVYVVISILFFVLTWWFVKLCDALMGGES